VPGCEVAAAGAPGCPGAHDHDPEEAASLMLPRGQATRRPPERPPRKDVGERAIADEPPLAVIDGLYQPGESGGSEGAGWLLSIIVRLSSTAGLSRSAHAPGTEAKPRPVGVEARWWARRGHARRALCGIIEEEAENGW
jgi:hypothetical protein